MQPLGRKILTSLLVGLSVTIARGASAQSSITIGTLGVPFRNCLPFSCGSAFDDITGYQQVFSQFAFSGPVTITGLRFHASPFSPGLNATAILDLSWSTTTRAVGGLSSVLASNVTGVNTPFAHVSLAGGPTGLTIAGTPYVYDPAFGNLLLSIAVSGWVPGPGGNYAADATSLCSRAYNVMFAGTPVNTTDNQCLVTTLEVGPVVATPEPATFALLAGGLVGIGAVARRRRRRRD